MQSDLTTDGRQIINSMQGICLMWLSLQAFSMHEHFMIYTVFRNVVAKPTLCQADLQAFASKSSTKAFGVHVLLACLYKRQIPPCQ